VEGLSDTVADFGELIAYFVDGWWPKIDPFSSKPRAVLLPSATAVENLEMACAQRGVVLKNTRFFSPSKLREFLKSSWSRFLPAQESFRIVPEKTLKFWLRNALRASTRLQALKLRTPREKAGMFLRTFALWRRTNPARRQFFFDADFSFFSRQWEVLLSRQRAVLSTEEAYQHSGFREKLFQSAFVGGFSPQNEDELPLLRLCAQLSERVTFVNLPSGNSHRDGFWQSVTAHLSTTTRLSIMAHPKGEDAESVTDLCPPHREGDARRRLEMTVPGEGGKTDEDAGTEKGAETDEGGRPDENTLSDEGDRPSFPSSSPFPSPSAHFSAETVDEEIAQVCGQLRVVLGSRPKERVAIILPSGSSVENMLLQERLHREGIPFSSALSFPPHVRSHPIVHAWCRWQKSDHIDDYASWIRRLFSEGFPDDALKKALEEEISSAVLRLAWPFSGLLLDWVREKTGNGRLKDFLGLARLWPEKADLPTFLDALERVMDNGLWGAFSQEQRSGLFQELRPWALVGKKCSRFSFIEWLEASLRECFSETPNYASPSAKVCLITPAEFDHGTWSCVFLLRSAERMAKRPPWSPNPFLQTTGRALGRKSLSGYSRPSSFAGNAGHLEENGAQENSLALDLKKIRGKFSGANAYFFSISRANENVGSSAPAVPSFPNPSQSRKDDYSFSLSQEKGNVDSSAPAVSSSPNPAQSDGGASEPLNGASGPLERNALSPPPLDYSSTAPEPFGELKKIHRDRRDPRVPFGAWDYGLGAPLGKFFAFSCKTWETLLRHPEEAWYRHLLGSGEFLDFSESDWRKVALGTWVHDFLHFPEASGSAMSLPEAAEGCGHIQARAERFRKNTEAFLAGRGQRVPPVWEMLWREALGLAQRLFRRVAQWGKACPFRSEFTLPEGSHLSFASGHTLTLSGRIDLFLERGTQNWIVDYKTGGDFPLACQAWYRSNAAGQALVSAKGLQLLLYGWALRSRGWKNIHLWLLRPDAPVGEEEAEAVCLETLEENPAFRKFLGVFEKIVTGGILGLWPALRSSSKRCRRPLAVLPIEEAVLQQRCLKTFACLWE
jgi:hypothetical protein